MKKTLMFLVVALASVLAYAGVGNGLKVSLLTCEPGPAIYEHYGHTALRVRMEGDSVTPPLDVVFNYGCFDFNAPNFVWRFILGQTDYMLCYYPFWMFEREYVEADRRVWEQTLNLAPEEAERLVQALFVNASLENRTYRYNFLYNNCTTRCRDIIEEAVAGSVQWPRDNREKSLRDIMHEYNDCHSWASMGIDLLLGSGIDRNSTGRERMFAPMYMMHYMDSALVCRDGAGAGVPLAQPAVAIVNPATPYAADGFPVATIAMVLLAVGMACIAFRLYATRRHAAIRRMSMCIMAMVGLVGFVPTFLFFFSEHPAVDTNLLVLVFNPLPLVALACHGKAFARKLCFVLLAFAALVVVLPQSIPFSIYTIILVYIAALALFLKTPKTSKP